MAYPTTYKPKYIKLIDKYIKECNDKIYDYHKLSGKTEGYEEKITVTLPTVEGFCIYIKTHRQTVYKWKKANPKFKEALERIEVVQKQRLMEKGLSGHYSPVIAKLLLSSNHGMKEKTDVTSDDEPIGTFDDKTIDRIAERITSRKGTVSGTSSKK